MRVVKVLMVGLTLFCFAPAQAEIGELPGGTTWYLHVDFEQMRAEGAGKGVYDFLADEVFDEVKEESGVDLEHEMDSLTGYSLKGQGPVFVFGGNVSQVTKDRLMTFIAAEGDIRPKKTSGLAYYRLTDGGRDGDKSKFETDNIEIQLDELENESWISMALDGKVLLTSSEAQMQDLLKRKGKIAGSRGNGSTLLVLTADKPLLQAGMDSATLGEESDGDSAWESNLLRNTEQVAFMVAAVKDNLAIEARLTATEPDMAESLASVVRGLISLASFSDDMDAAAIAVLQGTRIETDGRNLIISLAIASDLLVATLRD